MRGERNAQRFNFNRQIPQIISNSMDLSLAQILGSMVVVAFCVARGIGCKNIGTAYLRSGGGLIQTLKL